MQTKKTVRDTNLGLCISKIAREMWKARSANDLLSDQNSRIVSKNKSDKGIIKL